MRGAASVRAAVSAGATSPKTEHAAGSYLVGVDKGNLAVVVALDDNLAQHRARDPELLGQRAARGREKGENVRGSRRRPGEPPRRAAPRPSCALRLPRVDAGDAGHVLAGHPLGERTNGIPVAIAARRGETQKGGVSAWAAMRQDHRCCATVDAWT